MSLWKRLFGTASSTESEPMAMAAPPDFPFALVAVPGGRAIEEWKKYQALWRGEGCSAVLLGDRVELDRIVENFATTGEGSPASILEEAEEIEVERYLAQRITECIEDPAEFDEGEWPVKPVPSVGLSAHIDVRSRQPKPTVYLAKIPTTKAWEIPAHLQFGGWNDCPGPRHHVAVLRHWAEKYGVEVYAMTGDVVECTVASPPKTREAAMVLAREQFLYCTDNVYQGTETLAVLGATVMDAKVWYFWWD